MSEMNQDNFLAKWLEGTLSKEELQEFENTEEYTSYAKIVSRTSELSVPHYNTTKEYFDLIDKLPSKKEEKVIKLDRGTLFFRIAAVFILALGLYYFFTQQDISVDTNIAQQKSILLPDTSEVLLNASSSIAYNKNTWNERRALKLDGEAYFKVAKGKSFDVVTQEGIVTVVGTEFNVKSRENYFEVICYEGVVKVMHRNIEKTLTIGDGFKVFNGVLKEENDLLESQPSWISDESIFKSIPLEFVLNELERQFKITIDRSNIDTSLYYSGGFTHTDIDKALASITIPLKLTYKLNGNKVVLYAQ